MKHALHTACTLLALTTLLQAQRGGGNRNLPPRYPAALEFYEFAPFLDSNSNPLSVGAIAADRADFDGDGNIDIWFLGRGAGGAEIAIQFANTADLGRFHTKESLTDTTFVSAATYRTSSSNVDQIIAIDPDSDEPFLLHWNPRSWTSDPRDGYLGGSLSGWSVGLGTYEIATADHTGDGHDDIVTLSELTTTIGTAPLTEITLLQMGTQKFNFLWVDKRISVTIGARLEMLRLLDVNGDQKTDFVAYAPGIGLIVFRQTANDFVVHGIFPTGSYPIRDIQIGDMDRNGLDDIAVVLDQGVVVIRHHQNHPSFPSGFEYRAYLNPAGVGSLHTCRILDASAAGTTLLIGLPRDGRNYVIHADNPGAFGLTEPWVEPAPASLTGPGVRAVSVIVADVDNDHDPDLVIQHPNSTHWLTLRNPAVTFRPTLLEAVKAGAAPPGEGAGEDYTVTVTVPRELVDDGALFVEVGFYVEDPTTNPNDPSYLYWGRLMPAINPFTYEASFTAYHWQDLEFDQQVREFKKYRHINSGSSYVYPPGVWETIRTGRRMFLTVHGIDGSKRYESAPGEPPPPKKAGSTLGGKWVLTAKPPSVKGDVELLPWE